MDCIKLSDCKQLHVDLLVSNDVSIQFKAIFTESFLQQTGIVPIIELIEFLGRKTK